ncbi:MAG: extracellular solute-binding protein [Desulfobacterales bacterium]|nr:extracellular solute-binding protein [Desulfobacterales bacterium]
MATRNLTRIIVTALFFLGCLALAATAGADPLAQIIDGAKKEGRVSVRIRSSFSDNSMKRLEKEIREKFGVDLKINYTPSGSMAKLLAHVMMEHKAGLAASYDLVNFSNHAAEGFKAGVLERVDWKPLITKDSNPEVVATHPSFYGSLIYYSSHQGLLYNPQKISADQVPKSFQELADPQWKHKVGIPSASSGWTRRAYLLGKEKIFSELQAILKNGAIQGPYTVLQTRYQLEEIWMAFTISSYWNFAVQKGVPAAWQTLDYAEVPFYSLAVPKGAKNPNAAKLVAVYLASPEGSRFTNEESGSGNLFYPGNYEHEISSQHKKQGIPEFFPTTDSRMIDFLVSKDYDKLRREVSLVLSTGEGGAKKKKKK